MAGTKSWVYYLTMPIAWLFIHAATNHRFGSPITARMCVDRFIEEARAGELTSAR